MKACRASRSTVSLTVNLSPHLTEARQTSCPDYFILGKEPRYRLNRRPVEPQSQAGRSGRDTNFLPCRHSNPESSNPQGSLCADRDILATVTLRTFDMIRLLRNGAQTMHAKCARCYLEPWVGSGRQLVLAEHEGLLCLPCLT